MPLSILALAQANSGLGTGDLIELGALVVAVGTFMLGLRQYARAQRVERAKFAINIVDEFQKQTAVRNTMLMLDWNVRDIELFPHKETAKDRCVTVTDAMLTKALRTNSDTFEDHEVAIRDTFDQFFDYLARFEHYVKARIISIEDVRPYLDYWIRLLVAKSTRKDKVFARAAGNYLRTYHFEPVISLIKRLGYEVPGDEASGRGSRRSSQR